MSGTRAADTPTLFAFTAGESGEWTIDRVETIQGDRLDAAERLSIVHGPDAATARIGVWTLRGVTSHTRYTTAHEAALLAAKQAPLARPGATRAALIPIRKSAQWWTLAQDERRAIYEERSRHTSIGLEYLPKIARRLHHSRDLGEPFDFLTWFEYAPEHADAFDELVARLRASEEWRFVDREIDVRLSRVAE